MEGENSRENKWKIDKRSGYIVYLGSVVEKNGNIQKNWKGFRCHHLLPGYVNFLAGVRKCRALLMPQLG
jgi:hypothetical protein